MEELQKLARQWVEERGSQQRSQQRSQKQEWLEEGMEEACLSLWLAMFDHDLKGSELESDIVSALAVLGLNQEGEGWSTAMNYTPILSSAVVTITRGLVEQAFQEAVERSMTQREARGRAPSIFEEVREMVTRFMTLTTFDGIPSIMDRIF